MTSKKRSLMWNSTSTETPITDTNSQTVHSHFPMLRTITVHSEDSIRFTSRAKEITQELNEYRRGNGEVSLKEMARIFGLGETNCTHYYYGKCYPQDDFGYGYTQMRRGACVDI